MSILLDKSKIYKRAADNLHSKKLFCPEAHCRYYSCVQWMLHIAKSCSLPVVYVNRSLHVELINKISMDISKQTGDANQRLQFWKKIDRLKKFRVKADYEEYLLSDQEVEETKTLESSVKGILTEVYGIT